MASVRPNGSATKSQKKRTAKVFQKSAWKTSEPPKKQGKTVKLRYQDDRGKIRQGLFYWESTENTWIQCDDPEGIGLYEQDGYKVLGWKKAR